jgi:hypothetical protein
MRLCRYGAATAAHNERMVSLPQGGGPAATSRDTGERFPARRAAPVTGHGNQRAATNSADSPAGRLDNICMVSGREITIEPVRDMTFTIRPGKGPAGSDLQKRAIPVTRAYRHR